MDTRQYLSQDTSILYRAAQKHFDRIFNDIGLGYGQVLFLIYIYENEGIAMSKLADLGNFDKGTITHSVNRLVDMEYVRVETNASDRRVKKLYTTAKSQKIITRIYNERQKWWEHLFAGIDSEDVDKYLAVSKIITEKAQNEMNETVEDDHLRIFGIQKLTLLDYPGQLATILFTGGCNFRCPYCHNRSLVFLDEDACELDGKEILELLQKRRGLIDGVVISGGEPLLQEGLKAYLQKIKALGFKVKLDTNGLLYEKLKELIEDGLIDYVAMDIKNSQDKYAKTAGVDILDLKKIDQSIDLLINSQIDYEFRTTVVDEFHEVSDIEKIARRLKGAKHYYLQSYRESDNVIKKGLHAPSEAKLKLMLEKAQQYIPSAMLRGAE